MDRKDVIKQLVEILGQIQEDLGGTPQEITPSTIPVGGIQGFDSLVGTVVAIGIAQKFNLPDDEKLDKLFVKTERGGSVTHYNVDQIAGKILELRKNNEGS